MEKKLTGRVTIPTDMDVVPETLELMKRWGADAIRDCDGTDFPEEIKGCGGRRFIRPITPPERIMSGRKRTRMRSSSAIL